MRVCQFARVALPASPKGNLIPMESPVRFGSVRFRSGPVPVPAVRFYRFFDFLGVFFEIFNAFRPFLHGKNDPQILIILSLFYDDFFRHIFL